MKSFISVVSISFIGFVNLSAQNYQTVYSHRIAYFDNQYGNVKCIRIDSAQYDTDSVFFPFSTIQQLDYECFTPYGPSWIGEKVIVMDSMNLFFNLKKDTIRIKTSARLNESWMAFDLENSIKILATVSGFDTLTFLGLKDSVKTIGFQVYDHTMTPVEHAVNDLTIAISKNFGLIKTVNFFLFPSCEFSYLWESLEEFNLIGLSEPKTGIQNLTWFEVFDFQKGDEVHTVYTISDWGSGNGYSKTTKTILKYLSRADQLPESIAYDADRKQSIFYYWQDSSSLTFLQDTCTITINPNKEFDKLPGEPVVSEHEAYYNFMFTDSLLSKTVASAYEYIWPGYNDSCWSNCCIDGCFSSYSYIKALGGPYFSCTNFISIGGEELKMVYYRKGSKTWGTPLVISDIPEADEIVDLEIYPNPATDMIWIKMTSSSLPADFEITDLNGKTLLQKEIHSVLTQVKISDDLHGFYLYRIIQKSEIIHNGKLLVE